MTVDDRSQLAEEQQSLDVLRHAGFPGLLHLRTETSPHRLAPDILSRSKTHQGPRRWRSVRKDEQDNDQL